MRIGEAGDGGPRDLAAGGKPRAATPAVAAAPGPRQIPAAPGNVHYRWDAALPPIAEVDPGTVLTIETRSGEDDQLRLGDGPDAVDRLDFSRLHALTGPILVRGAVPGQLLVVRVESFDLGPSGFVLQRAGAGLLRGFPTYLRWVDLDAAAGLARFAPGIDIPLAPFLGVMGVAPAGPPVRTIEPGPHGGNLDCRDLGAGATLYLPIQVPGALFSCGDAHAAQGDGEVCVTAIETALRVRLQLDLLVPATLLADPVAETPDAWMTLSAAATVEEAAARAVEAMIGLIAGSGAVAGSTRLSRADAYALVSAAGDVRINQLVNGDRFGVRVVLPKAILAMPSLGSAPAPRA
jgi:acetamidase/formamidase